VTVDSSVDWSADFLENVKDSPNDYYPTLHDSPDTSPWD
jgi:hypothetical protein